MFTERFRNKPDLLSSSYVLIEEKWVKFAPKKWNLQNW